MTIHDEEPRFTGPRANEHFIEHLDHQARYILRNTRIDLDAFLALDGEARAARWRQWDRAAKFQAVAQMLARKFGDWDPEAVETWIARYDAKWGAEPLTTELAVAGALEAQALQNSRSAETAAREDQEDLTGDVAAFRRSATAFTNALIEWEKGVRPQRTPSGAYVLPSRRPGEPPHMVRLVNGAWTCNCKAGSSMHWPIALMTGIEIAYDDLDRFDDMPHALGEPPSPAVLGRRLAAAREQLMRQEAA